jgi:hypothetical protein
MTELPESTARLEQVFVGVDIGKAHHWVCAVDTDGGSVLSVKVVNDETKVRDVIATVSEMADDARWAVDIIGAPACRSRPPDTQPGLRYEQSHGSLSMTTGPTLERSTPRICLRRCQPRSAHVLQARGAAPNGPADMAAARHRA